MVESNPYAPPQPPAAPDAVPLLEETIDETAAIVARGGLDEEDFFAALRLHRRASRPGFVIALILILLFIGGALRLGQAGPPGVAWLFPLLIALGIVLLVFILPRLAAGRMWNSALSLREPVKRLITPFLFQTISSKSNVLLRWSAFATYRKTDRVVLLYFAENPQLFIVVPRNSFQTDDQWRQFLGLVESRLAPK